MFDLGPTRNDMRSALAASSPKDGRVVITYHNGEIYCATLVAVLNDSLVVTTILGPEIVSLIGVRSVRQELS